MEIALRAGAPIVPVAVVGSEEIYPKLADVPRARAPDRRALLPGHADVPVAGPARGGAAAVEVADRVLRPDRDGPLRPRGGERRGLVLELTEQVRDTVQQAVYANLVRRGSAFV